MDRPMVAQGGPVRIAMMAAVLMMAMAGATWAQEGSPACTAQVLDGRATIKQGEAEISVALEIPRLALLSATGSEAPGVEAFKAEASGLTPEQLLRGDVVELACAPGANGIEAKLCLQWAPEERILRKWARFKAPGGGQCLAEVVLEDIDIAKEQAEVPPPDVQSHPVFLSGAFCGIEYPVSATRAENGRLLLACKPGLHIAQGIWHETRKAVFGLAAIGHEREAFRRYILAHRVAPNDVHVDYNSWWTSPCPYTEKDILDLMQVFNERLNKPYGGRFDTFCIDMGWSNANSLWGIDAKLFPSGFERVSQAAEAMGARLGLWTSPSGVYAPALDVAWGKSQGYETQKDAFCLGGPHYSEAFAKQMAQLVGQYGIQQLKFDGYRPTCEATDHGHEPGALSAEPIAEGIIRAATAVRERDKNVWIETTCFGWNPSPWWLIHFNSVIGSFGDDAPFGRVPAPVYRESYTTARDFFNLQGAYWSPIPAAAQEVLGVIHQTADPFLNDAVMTVMRGHRFLPLYVNPRDMDDARWKALAEVMAWARRMVPGFRETHALLPEQWRDGQCPRFDSKAVMPREAYGYAHAMADRTIVALRNPWIQSQSFALVLNEQAGFLPAAQGLAAVSAYPEPRTYATGLRFGDTLEVPLAPYETLVLEFAPESGALPPPVAEAKAGAIEIANASHSLKKVVYEEGTPAFGPDWSSLVGDAPSATQLHLEAAVRVDGAAAQLVILLDGATEAPSATCQIDGAPASLHSSDSESGWGASGMPRPEQWVFLVAPLHEGENRIAADVAFGGEHVTPSVWIWKKRVGGASTAEGALPQPEEISLDAVALLAPTPPPTAKSERIARPVERINGIFLDAVEPTSATQGWGTLQKNKSIWEKPLIIAGQRFQRGLGAHAPSRIVYTLDGKYRRFQAWAGADAATTPTVTFEVWVDGTKCWESGLMRREDSARRVDVDIAGAKELVLIVGDGGNGLGADHADWADARLLR